MAHMEEDMEIQTARTRHEIAVKDKRNLIVILSLVRNLLHKEMREFLEAHVLDCISEMETEEILVHPYTR